MIPGSVHEVVRRKQRPTRGKMQLQPGFGAVDIKKAWQTTCTTCLMNTGITAFFVLSLRRKKCTHVMRVRHTCYVSIAVRFLAHCNTIHYPLRRIQNTHRCMYTGAQTRAHIYAYIHTLICSLTNTHIHTYMHTCMHTNT